LASQSSKPLRAVASVLMCARAAIPATWSAFYCGFFFADFPIETGFAFAFVMANADSIIFAGWCAFIRCYTFGACASSPVTQAGALVASHARSAVLALWAAVGPFALRPGVGQRTLALVGADTSPAVGARRVARRCSAGLASPSLRAITDVVSLASPSMSTSRKANSCALRSRVPGRTLARVGGDADAVVFARDAADGFTRERVVLSGAVPLVAATLPRPGRVVAPVLAVAVGGVDTFVDIGTCVAVAV